VLDGIREPTEGEVARVLQELDVYGYSVARSVLRDDVVADLLAQVRTLWVDVDGIELAGRPARDAEDRLVYNLQARDVRFVDLLVCDLVRSVCMAKLNDPYYRFLPPDVPNYILSYYNARSSGRALDLHIDSYLPSPSDATWSMQVVFVLEPATRENGCTVVVPGSHRSGRYSDRTLVAVEDLDAAPGDVVLWDSRLWHGTRANATGGTRWALVATLTQWWVKQARDMTRSLPEEIYAALDDERRALLGFCSIPPRSERERVNTKAGYDALRPTVADYWS
jgi:ectoine hydroxylase-related dioxygenase (phytanoyl-CoA dioxygenase family)